VTDRFFYKVKVLSFILCLWISISSPDLNSFAGSIEDIHSKLNVKKGAVSNQSKKDRNKFEIKNIRKTKITGWKFKGERGRREGIHGIELTFKINERGDYIDMPYAVCYFYDKEKNLIDRIKANFIYGGKWLELDDENVLQFKGKKNIKIAFGRVASFKFKYGICVIGNRAEVSAAIIPKSAEIDGFDFDEKSLVKR